MVRRRRDTLNDDDERAAIEAKAAAQAALLAIPATNEIDCRNIEHDCEVFVNRWCSLFGHRATALGELRVLVERVRAEERAAK